MSEIKVELHTPFIKIDQLLKYAGVSGSGGEASYMIESGFITHEGIIVTQRGKKVRAGERVVCRIPESDEITIIVEKRES